MNIGRILLAAALLLGTSASHANIDYKKDAKFKELRDSMSHAFNDGDSARFYTHLTNLQNYLLENNDLHGYYTQRCNDIIFEMNLHQSPGAVEGVAREEVDQGDVYGREHDGSYQPLLW